MEIRNIYRPPLKNLFYLLFLQLEHVTHTHIFIIQKHTYESRSFDMLRNMTGGDLNTSGSCVSSVNKQLCSRDVASYSLRIKIDGYSELQSSVKKETNSDIFCIHSQNRKSHSIISMSNRMNINMYKAPNNPGRFSLL